MAAIPPPELVQPPRPLGFYSQPSPISKCASLLRITGGESIQGAAALGPGPPPQARLRAEGPGDVAPRDWRRQRRAPCVASDGAAGGMGRGTFLRSARRQIVGVAHQVNAQLRNRSADARIRQRPHFDLAFRAVNGCIIRRDIARMT